MANEGDLKITKGETKTYTYYGDSGKLHTCSLCSPSPLPPFPPRLFLHPPTPTSLNRSSYPLPSIEKTSPVTSPPLSHKKTRQARKLLLLPQLHLAHLPPPDGAGPEDRRPHGPAQGERRLPRQGGDFRKGSPGVAEGDCADVSGTAGVRVVWDLEVWGWGVRREGGG